MKRPNNDKKKNDVQNIGIPSESQICNAIL